MAFALLIVGAFLLVAAVKGTQGDLAKLFKNDFTGQNNFIYWMTAIFIIGAIGYIPKLKGLSTMFLGLVVVVLFLKKGDPSGIGGGFFSQFSKGIASTAATTPAPATATAVTPSNPLTVPTFGGYGIPGMIQ